MRHSKKPLRNIIKTNLHGKVWGLVLTKTSNHAFQQARLQIEDPVWSPLLGVSDVVTSHFDATL